MSNTPNDYLEMVDALNGRKVEYVLVGAYAVAFYGYPRDSLDFDILLRPTPENVARANAALKDFGSPFVIMDDDIKTNKLMQLGVKPVRIDLLSAVTGVSSEEIWAKRVSGRLEGREVAFISYEHLLENKRAAGRPKDLLDVQQLEKIKGAQSARKSARKPKRRS